MLRGVIQGLWLSCLPGLALSTALALYWITNANRTMSEYLPILATTWSTFLSAPLVAARFSVRKINPVMGWLWTAGIAGGLPSLFGILAAGAMVAGGAPNSDFQIMFAVAFTGFQFALAFLCPWITVKDLAGRQFQLRPFQRVAS
jgi:hypothetical protein